MYTLRNNKNKSKMTFLINWQEEQRAPLFDKPNPKEVPSSQLIRIPRSPAWLSGRNSGTSL